MFSLDRWLEVFDTLRRNKLRTALTAISVAWGIFVLVVLLGLGRGLDNGIRHQFAGESTNAVWMSAAKTSVPFAGYSIGRKVNFDNKDYAAIRTLPGVGYVSGQFFIHGGQFGGGTMLTRRGTKANSFDIQPVHPDLIKLNSNQMLEGRFLDEADVVGKRKSAVIGLPVRDFLFGTEEAIGQWIIVAGVPFQVVGVFTYGRGEEEERAVIIPVTTAQLAFNGLDHLGMLMFTVGDANAEQAKAIAASAVAEIAARHQFSPTDKQAIHVHDSVEQFERFRKLFWMISVFVVVIGFGTLAAGVVGVSNIMMIAVKERTKEIGVRKALGATPWSIIGMITHEAVFLTGLAGLLGLAAGVGVLGLVGSAAVSDFILHPSIDLNIGVISTIGLIIAGALAGYFPARAAARVNPIYALRDQ